MDIHTQYLAFAAFFVAAFLKGLTGIGFSTLCLGFLAIFVDIRLAIPLVFLPSLSSNLMVMAEAGKFRDAVGRFWPLFLSGLAGLLPGIWVLGTGSGRLSRCCLGIVMVLYGISSLVKGQMHLSGRGEKRYMVPVGVVSGMVNGATGSQIMPIMPYLLALDMDRRLFVQTINLSFTINTLVMILCLGKLGFLGLHTVLVSAAGIVPVAAGIFAGTRIRRKVSDIVYRKMVLYLLVCLGMILVARALVSV